MSLEAAFTPCTGESFPPFINFKFDGEEAVVTVRGPRRTNLSGIEDAGPTVSFRMARDDFAQLLVDAQGLLQK